MGDTGHPIDEVASEVASALLPGVGPLVSWMSSKVRQETQRLTSKALKAAEATSGRTREELQEIFEQDPSFLPLYMRVLWAAGMNGHDETLGAMGATLGDAVRATDGGDSESVEDADQALMAMSALTPRHFRVLRFLSSHPKRHEISGKVLEKERSGWIAEKVAEEMGLTEDRAAWCLSDLAGAGLVEASSAFGGAFIYRITDLGHAVVRASDTLDATS